MEAIPIPEITAEIVGRAFYEKWICRFGVPAKVVTDQGRQFEAELFRSIAAICGAKVAHTTSYHPQCNGKVERLHRTLKGAIKAPNNIRWTESLPTVLLGLRAAIRPDISYTIAQMVYGTSIKLPGKFFDPPTINMDPQNFVAKLQQHMAELKPLKPPSNRKQNIFVHKDLKSCSHVFIRIDRVKKALEPPYEGPYTVQKRWALDWLEVLGFRVVEDKATDYAHLKQALSEQFPVVRNRSELETRFYSSSQKHNQKPSDFVYDLLKIHKILKLEMTEEKLIDHIISRLEPPILDYVEVRHPQTTSNLLQIIDKYEERFLNRKIRGSIWESRDIQPNENNRFPNRNRQENWRETIGNNRYADNSRPRREFNRFENQGVADNQRFDGRRRGGQSDHRFDNQGGRQGGSKNSAFRGQNDRNRYLNF
ncbi:retrovirus-related Pol polyprotein from transposon opus [Trichonephila clavipes]|nr:retrovirus-related Pol polyprotein from transposon opus [Trichonephila clavipes]